jgi:hypothetical protein
LNIGEAGVRFDFVRRNIDELIYDIRCRERALNAADGTADHPSPPAYAGTVDQLLGLASPELVKIKRYRKGSLCG